MSMDGEFTNGPDGDSIGVSEASPRVSPARVGTGERDESAFRSRSTVLLASWLVPVTPPMRMPDGMWALMITEVTVHCCRDRAEAVDWFFGYWLAEGTPAHRYRDGDVVLRLFEPLGTRGKTATASRVDVDMLLRSQDGWRRVGLWPAQRSDWPRAVAYTADALMALSPGVTDRRL